MGESIANALSNFWDSWSYEVLMTVATLVVAWVAVRVVRRALGRWSDRIRRKLLESHELDDRERGQRLVTLTDVARIVTAIAIWIVAVLTIMGIWGIPMTPLLAIGTTIGVAVGFGAQDLVRDVIAGFLILLEDQYSIGDVVTIAGVEGAVEAINLRTTVLRDLSGNVHHVPNGQIAVASNKTAGFSRVVADVGVSYDTDIDRALSVMGDEAEAMASDDAWRAYFVGAPDTLGVNELGDSAVVLRVLLTVTTDERWMVKREFYRRIKNRFDREGIEIPYAYLNVVMRGDDQT